MFIEVVPKSAIDMIWDQVKDLISKTDDNVLTADDVKQYLKNGTYTLWVAIDGGKPIAAMTTEFAYYPRDKVCRVVTLAGKRMKDWIHHLDDVEDWAKKQGCSYIDMYGRRGWLRVLTDWKEDSILLRKKL